MEWWQVYLFTRLDSFNYMFYVAAMIGVPILAIYIILCFYFRGEMTSLEEDLKIRKKLLKNLPKVTLIYAFFPLVACFIPTEKEMAVIYLLPKITKNETMKEVEKLPKNMALLLNKKCEEYINRNIGLEEKKGQ